MDARLAGRLTTRTRILVSLYLGAAATVVAWLFQDVEQIANDFPLFWWSAKALVMGLDPYRAVGPTGSLLQWFTPVTYPLTGIIPIAPLTLTSVSSANLIFGGVSTAVLAFALLRDDYHRLPVFLSGSFLFAITSGQWSPLMTAAALVPPLGFLLVAKPTTGLALFLYRPTWIATLGCLALVVVSLAIRPSWPLEWWASAMQVRSEFRVPLLVPGGQLLLLALLKWKRADARLLLALAVVPQSMLPYEGVILFLITVALWEGLALAALSWVAMAIRAQANVTSLDAHYDLFALLIVLLMYLPALAMVLRRPNEGDTPDLLRALGRDRERVLRGSTRLRL